MPFHYGMNRNSSLIARVKACFVCVCAMVAMRLRCVVCVSCVPDVDSTQGVSQVSA
jgi:hypothetical protein